MVTCCGTPMGVPFPDTSMRQMFSRRPCKMRNKYVSGMDHTWIQVLKPPSVRAVTARVATVDYFYAEFRTLHILVDDVLAVGRPVRFQVIHASELSEVICCGLCPCASTTQMRRGPAQEASTASVFPSGEKAGLKALSRNSLPCRRRDPFSRCLHLHTGRIHHPAPACREADCERTNKMLWASGVHFGWMSSPVPESIVAVSP